MVGTTVVTVGIYNAVRVAELAKNTDKSIVTVIGGVHASALLCRTLEEFGCFDYLVYGEGEITLSQLVEKVS